MLKLHFSKKFRFTMNGSILLLHTSINPFTGKYVMPTPDDCMSKTRLPLFSQRAPTHQTWFSNR